MTSDSYSSYSCIGLKCNHVKHVHFATRDVFWHFGQDPCCLHKVSSEKINPMYMLARSKPLSVSNWLPSTQTSFLPASSRSKQSKTNLQSIIPVSIIWFMLLWWWWWWWWCVNPITPEKTLPTPGALFKTATPMSTKASRMTPGQYSLNCSRWEKVQCLKTGLRQLGKHTQTEKAYQSGGRKVAAPPLDMLQEASNLSRAHVELFRKPSQRRNRPILTYGNHVAPWTAVVDHSHCGGRDTWSP